MSNWVTVNFSAAPTGRLQISRNKDIHLQFVSLSSSPQREIPFETTATHGYLIATGTTRGHISVMNASTGTFKTWRVAAPGKGIITSMSFMSRGKELCVVLNTCQILVYNVASTQLSASMHHARAGTSCLGDVRVSLDPTNLSMLCTWSLDSLVLWTPTHRRDGRGQPDSWEKHKVLLSSGEGFKCVRVSGDLAMVLCADGRLLSWSLTDLSLRFQLDFPLSEGLRAMTDLSCFAASGKRVVAGGANRLLYFWDTSIALTCTQAVELPASVQRVCQVEFTRTQYGDSLAVLGDDGRVHVMLCHAQDELQQFSIAFSLGTQVDSFSVGPRYLITRNVGGEGKRGGCDVFDLLASIERSEPSQLHPRASAGVKSVTSDRGVRFLSASPNRSRGREPSRIGTEGPSAALALGDRGKIRARSVTALLSSKEQLPERHRPLIWRCLLRLPENGPAFTALVRKGPHPAFSDLGARYPLRDSRTLRKLKAVLSALAWWSPLCAELEYLPATVFPFLTVFGNDDLASFETTLALLSRWERHFLCTYPHPPLPLLGSLASAVALHDPNLARHLEAIGAGPQVYAWPLLRSAFTEVLSSEEWLVLWDHIFAMGGEKTDPDESEVDGDGGDAPLTLMLACLALLLVERAALKTMRSKSDVQAWSSQPCGIDTLSVVKTLATLRNHAPTVALFRATTLEIEAEDSDDGVALRDRALEGTGCVGAPPWPLPRQGPYPPLRGFPRFAMDFQLAQRARLLATQEAARVKQVLVDEVTNRSRDLVEKEARWRSRQLALEEAEAHRQEELEVQRDRCVDEEAARGLNAQRRSLELALHLSGHAENSLDLSVQRSERHATVLAGDVRKAEARADATAAAAASRDSVSEAVQAAVARVAAMAAARGDEERAREFAAELMRKRDEVMVSERRLLQAWAVEDESSAENEVELFERRTKAESRRAAMAGAASDAALLEQTFSNQTSQKAADASLSVSEHRRRRIEELSKARVRRQERADELSALFDTNQSSSLHLASSYHHEHTSHSNATGDEFSRASSESAAAGEKDDAQEFLSQAKNALAGYS